MRKQKRQMCVRRMLLFFLACVLICSAPPSAAQAAKMQTAKNSTVQKKKTSTKTVTIETSGEIIKKKVKSGGSVILPVEVNKRGYTFLDRPVIQCIRHIRKFRLRKIFIFIR